MLHSLLAWTMGLGSLSLFASGFFFPEIRRKNDLIWSGIGLFYALVMAIDSGRLQGGMVLEELASVILIVWFCLQILQQRRRKVPIDKQTPIPNSVESWTTFFKEGWGRLQLAFSDPDSLEYPYEDEDSSFLDVSKFSAAITGLFKKEAAEKPATIPAPTSVADVSSTTDDEWEEEDSDRDVESPSPSPAATETTTTESVEPSTSHEQATNTESAPSSTDTETSTEVAVDTEPSTANAEMPVEETQSIVGAVTPTPDVTSSESGEVTEDISDREQSIEPTEPANPEMASDKQELASDSTGNGENSETSNKSESSGEESWPPPDAPT